MEIRVFEESDEREVVSLWKQVFAYPEARNDPATVIRHKMAAQRNLFFVAVADGRLVGTVMGGYDGHRGWIYSLAVDPAHRRQKVGTALIRQVERALVEAGLYGVVVDCYLWGEFGELEEACEELFCFGGVVEEVSGSGE